MAAAGALFALAAATRLDAQGALWPMAIAPPAVAESPGGAAAGIDAYLSVDVPFVPQGELLCGGAAAAMVLRYHGERGASAESFAHLVRKDEGGIRTDELVAELAARGWTARAATGDLAALGAALGAGLPPIVLLESGTGRWHYVVVVGLEVGPDASPSPPMSRSRKVRVHDPALSPDVELDEAEFLRRWDGGRRWMVVVEPSAGSARPGPAAAAPAIELDPSPALLRASERFRASDWTGAAEAAEAATRATPTDLRAWRLLGGSLYLAGRADDALDAWARAGEPRIDGVDVTGLARTRHPVVHALLGLEPGARLERGGLERARRRAALLPTAAYTRVAYRAESGGWAEVEAVALEGPAHPFSRRGLTTAALAAAAGELTAWGSGLAGAGERLEARWRPGDEGGARLTLAAPGAFGLPGRTEVGLARVDASRHVGAWLRTTDWAAGWLRWEAGVRADRFEGGALHPGLTGALHGAAPWGALVGRVGGALWAGERGGALGAIDLSLALGAPVDAWTAQLRGGVRALAGDAALDLHPGVGSWGRTALAGPFAGADPLPLLRAHETVRGRRVAHGGVEAIRWVGTALRVGLAAFADGAIVDRDGGAERFLDVGLGARATLGDLPGAVRVDHAWSHDGGQRRWSFGWELPGAARLSP